VKSRKSRVPGSCRVTSLALQMLKEGQNRFTAKIINRKIHDGAVAARGGERQ
jgi:hypothetical protein